MPPWPVATARQFSSMEVPSAEIAPRPVTAMRFTSGPGSGGSRGFGAGLQLVHQLAQRLAVAEFLGLDHDAEPLLDLEQHADHVQRGDPEVFQVRVALHEAP